MAWVVEKFYHFLYANHFILETDLKPLETILSSSLNQITPRLQRILIRTFPYNFTFRYLPGLKNLLADCLLWVGGFQDSIKVPKLSVHQITSQLNAMNGSLQQLREATQADDTLALLKYTIQQGWPSSIKDLPSEIQSFWTFQRRTYYRGLPDSEGNTNCYPKQEARCNAEPYSWGTPGSHQMQATCKRNSVLARA